MNRIAKLFTIIVAIEHAYFLVLEMFFWTEPIGLRAFGNTAEVAASSAVLAANQGLYNGFLAAGLVFSLLRGHKGIPTRLFFLGCVIVAGIFGAATAKFSILFVQAVPGAIAFAMVWLSRNSEAADDNSAA